MGGFIIALVSLGIAMLIWFFRTYQKLKDEEKLKDLVAWIVCKDDHIRYNIPLWAHINDAQLHCNVPKKHRISWDEEREYVNEILSVFREHISQSFFRGEISYKRIFDLTLPTSSTEKKEFFIFRLFCFLSENHTNSHVWSQELYAKQLSYKSYGMWGGPLYDAVYELSDFGRTVQKLYYITFLACKASVIYKKNIAGWLTPEYFTEVLDRNQIHISRV